MTTVSVRVRVVGRDGKPVSNALVSIVAASVPVPEIALVPDSDGVISLRLPADAQFTLRAICSDSSSGECTVSTARADRAGDREGEIKVS